MLSILCMYTISPPVCVFLSEMRTQNNHVFSQGNSGRYFKQQLSVTDSVTNSKLVWGNSSTLDSHVLIQQGLGDIACNLRTSLNPCEPFFFLSSGTNSGKQWQQVETSTWLQGLCLKCSADGPRELLFHLCRLCSVVISVGACRHPENKSFNKALS